jgi:hypothetical protein
VAEEEGSTMTTRTAEEARADYERVMGSELGAIYNALWQQLAWLHSKWAEYVDLFGMKESRVSLMNEVAPRFFRLVQDSLWDDVLIHVARLTDPPKSAGRANLTIQRLPLVVDVAVKAEVEGKIAAALTSCSFARDWRNRRIAHGDYALALDLPGANPLTPTSSQMVREALESLCEVINAVGLHYLDSTNLFDAGPSHYGAASLLYVLDAGLEAERERSARIKAGQIDLSERRPRDL